MNQAIFGTDFCANFLHNNQLLDDHGEQCLIHSATYATIIAPSLCVCNTFGHDKTFKPPQINSIYANPLTFSKDRVPHGVRLVLTLVSHFLSARQLGICPPKNQPSSRLHLMGWRSMGLFDATPINGHPHSTLHPSLVVVGTPVGILDASMAASRLIVIQYPTSRLYLSTFRKSNYF